MLQVSCATVSTVLWVLRLKDEEDAQHLRHLEKNSCFVQKSCLLDSQKLGIPRMSGS